MSPPGVRPVNKILAHIATSTRIWEEVHKKKLTTLVGLNYAGLMEEFNAEENKPRSKAEIVEAIVDSHEYDSLVLKKDRA